jgi:hypothetical protein
MLPNLVLLSVGCLVVFTVISAYRAFAGLSGPFPMQKAKPVGTELLWLAGGVGLWLLGFFIPASWGLGGFGEGFNFALRGY